MQGLHAGFIIFTFASPLLLWLLSRHVKSRRFAVGINWCFAGALATAHGSAIVERIREDTFVPHDLLPMQLCDWALISIVIALTLRSQLCFELAYFWGLAGTLPALITPELDTSSVAHVIRFFVVHSAIPAGVLWLIFEFKMRPLPGAWLRIVVWSEIYIALALLANALTGENYGFLSHPPTVRSLLDLFRAQPPWLYVAQINLTALLFYFVLDLPWQIARRRAAGP
jgi:hypothetical integral membrane protein (TIGR02206 family)